MFNTFICGSFQNQENEDTLSPCSTPKRSRRSGSYKNKENKNRYSNLGLDKFNALLSELEEKKQKIYTQKGAEDIDLVQFDITSDNEIKPIVVVKVKRKRPCDASSITSSKPALNILQVSEQLKKHAENHETSSDKKLDVEEIPKKKRGYASSPFMLEKFKRPFYYLPVVVILILLFLAIYGRPFAILCTSIGWYLIPLLRGGHRKSSNYNINNKRKLKRKKEHYSRRLSENIIFRRNSNIIDGSSSPTSVFNGPAGVSPPRYDHRRSQ
ncbi:hypothetical protein LIER_02009 [Lithospermum erythrorhizon]|uniref:ZCF37 n=1 Tax=Lithospermum erythrorhizon TaxID=34254 RepID=A0AAV3NP20_LITER